MTTPLTEIPKIGTLIYYDDSVFGIKRYCVIRSIKRLSPLKNSYLFGNWCDTVKEALNNTKSNCSYECMPLERCYISLPINWNEVLK